MRLLALFAGLLAATVSGAYPPPPKPNPAGELPAVTLQALPLGTWLDDIRSLVKVVVPEGEVENVLKEFNDTITNKLDSFDGFDLKKPMAGYVLFGDAPASTALVLVIPYTDEAKFVTSISRGKPKATAIAGKKGLYKYDAENDPAPFPIRIQFHEGYAYVGINTPDEVLTASLVPASKLIDTNEKAHIVAKAKLDKIPANLKDIAKGGIGEFVANMKKDAARSNPISEKAAELFGSFISRQSTSFFTETDMVELKSSINPKTADLSNDYIVVPKAGTQMATDIAARKFTPNRFGSFVDKDNVGSVVFRAPLFAQELKDLATMGLKELKSSAEESAPPLFHPLLQAVLAGLEQNIKAGSLEAGVKVVGPSSTGTYSAVLGLNLADGLKIDEEVQKVVKAIAPKNIQDAITWNVEKANDANIHELDLSKIQQVLPSDVIGKNPKLCMAFGKDIFVACVGEDARAQIKTALGSKASAHAPVVDFKLNPKKIAGLLTAAKSPLPLGGIGFTEMVVLGLTTLDVKGGDKLTINQTMNLKMFTMFTGGRAAPGTFQAVPAAPVPVPVKP